MPQETNRRESGDQARALERNSHSNNFDAFLLQEDQRVNGLMSIRIIIADDHKIMRDGLRSLLAQQKGMEVIEEAEDGRQAVRLALKLKPDIIIMDLSMPKLNGIDAIREISSSAPGVKALALSMHSDKRFISRALKEGASGYVLKDCAFEELNEAIKTVLSNQIYLSPQLIKIVIGDYVSHLLADNSSVISALTAREREILQLLAEGISAKEIAGTLNLSVKTIETHRSRLMEKLDVKSIAELTKIAIREGLTSL
jgi:DNA-binding NarL/FixJ family response regulator